MDVQKTLRKLGVQPVKGQNFLVSDNIIEALVKAGETEEKYVLEIGAGTGSITEKLLQTSEKVTALETDTVLANHLEKQFEDSNVEIVNEDFLEYEIPEDIERCVSNLPFQITSEAVEKLGREQIQSSLILQKEIAEKIIAEPGDSNYNEFSVKTNYYFVPVKLRDVSSRNYHPAPEVNTSIVKLYPNRDRWAVEDEEFFFKIVKALFTHKRKKTRNAFVDARHILRYEKDDAKEIRDELPHSEERVINLEIVQLKEIAEFLADQ